MTCQKKQDIFEGSGPLTFPIALAARSTPSAASLMTLPLTQTSRPLELQRDNLWYKDAVIYQLHVRTIWLLPFYPSSLRDEGYDIADYTSVNPTYGSLEEFKTFLNAVHTRGIRVIIELVLNHTSDQQPWFQEAQRSRDNPRRDWYVWSDTDTRYKGVPIVFVDTEVSNWAWDPISKSYYWHRFFSHQPDLNYDNPAVFEAFNGMSMPGTPIICHGDEIGMGDNIYLGDRNGVRTPMQWSPRLNAGFSHAAPERLYAPVISNAVCGYQAVNVDAQERSEHSLLNWMKSLIPVRNAFRAFSRGSLQFLDPANPRVLAYTRQFGDEIVLVVSNLSNSAQAVELNVQRYKGYVPVEMFGRNLFPRFGYLPYLLTLGPYQFY